MISARSMGVVSAAFLCTVLAGTVSGADYDVTATLDIRANPATQTWLVTIELSGNPTDGMSSFFLDVIGSGEVSVTGSTMDATNFDGGNYPFLVSDGVNGIGITGTQDTISGDINLITLGEAVGSPLQVASGTYSGIVGALSVDVANGGGAINVFPSGWQIDDPTELATVVPDSINVFHAGDLDGDGDVDGNDFLDWQNGYPTPSGASLGDGDADGDDDVDGNDFLIWQNNYPYDPPEEVVGTLSLTAVPEPASLGLLIAGGIMLTISRRKISTSPIGTVES